MCADENWLAKISEDQRFVPRTLAREAYALRPAFADDRVL
jgi:hypothetical protein